MTKNRKKYHYNHHFLRSNNQDGETYLQASNFFFLQPLQSFGNTKIFYYICPIKQKKREKY